MPDESPEPTADEFLDWLCWTTAHTGERFYPPDATAEETAEAWEDEGLRPLGSQASPDDDGEEMNECDRGVIYGQHLRAINDADGLLKDLEHWGFDPKARAERYIEYARKEHDMDLSPIDWEWFENPRKGGEE